MIGSHAHHRSSTRLHAGPNMTPMVDLVMCLLIFFMLSSTFAVTEQLLRNQVPNLAGLSPTGTSSPIPAVVQRVTMQRMGKTGVLVTAFETVAPHPGDVAGLTAFFRQARLRVNSDLQILLCPDRDVPWSDVIRVYDALSAAGYQQVAFTNHPGR